MKPMHHKTLYSPCIMSQDTNCGDLFYFLHRLLNMLYPSLVGMGNEFNGTRYTVTLKEGMLISLVDNPQR